MDGPHGNMIHSTVPPEMVGRACRSLVFTCTTLPPWPGDDEAVITDGPWVPSADLDLGASSKDQHT